MLPAHPLNPTHCAPARSENFKDTEWVKVPRVLWDLSSSSVLTMEYTPGVKINKGGLVQLGSAREDVFCAVFIVASGLPAVPCAGCMP